MGVLRVLAIRALQFSGPSDFLKPPLRSEARAIESRSYTQHLSRAAADDCNLEIVCLPCSKKERTRTSSLRCNGV